MKIKISLAQMKILPGKVSENFSSAEKFIELAASQGSQLVLFPELWSSGFDLENRENYASENRRLFPSLLQAAQTHQIWTGGSIIEKSGEDYFNTFSMIDPGGQVAARYEKTHLFGLMNEPDWLASGQSLQTVELPWGSAGMAICYDLRFPELFRKYALAGTPILMVVGQWPLRRIDHWQVLLRARAIENQAFVLGVNTVGKIGKEIFGGRSAVIDPWGKTLIEGLDDFDSLLTTEINLEEVDRVRSKIPVFKDRRPDIYG